MPPGTPHRSLVTPKRPLDGSTSGSAAAGTANSEHISGLHASERMSNNIVRLAFEGSVACTSPPVRFQSNQLSMVPTARSSSTGIGRLASSHSIFEPLKYGSSTSPVMARTAASAPPAASWSHRAAVRCLAAAGGDE